MCCRERCSGHDEGPDEHKEIGNEDHNCVANHQKEDGPDDQAEWLMISLTASMSTRDEVFRRDRRRMDPPHHRLSRFEIGLRGFYAALL